MRRAEADAAMPRLEGRRQQRPQSSEGPRACNGTIGNYGRGNGVYWRERRTTVGDDGGGRSP
ncbi:hypothetical protein GQ600_19136 [Phytophthora cactorum]|nr:hypothetical protein GQ600_19136 [Phytophthora cactorum]